MSKKPSLTPKERRLKNAKAELGLENTGASNIETRQTTVILEADLLYSAKEVAIKRKREGIEPSTITGMIRKALKDIVDKESNA